MYQIVQNMILTWGLELNLSLLWTTNSYLRSASFSLEMGPKSEKCVDLCPHYISLGAKIDTLFTFWTHLYNKGCWPEIAVLYNRLNLSSKPPVGMICLIIWCILLPQNSILHDLLTIGFNGKTYGVRKLLATTVLAVFNRRSKQCLIFC